MRVRASGGSGGAIRARDLQMCVCHYVHMYVGTFTCERMHMGVCVRVDPMQACAYVRACLRARRERRRNPRSRPLAMCHYVHIYLGMSEPICICKRAYIEYMSARICVCVSACAYVRVSARRERRGRARPQDLHIHVYEHICIGMSAYIESMSA